MKRIDVSVLVVGSGPAGLSTALFLARYGIDVLIVTRVSSVADTPRAHITNQRTMEIMRDVGLEAVCYEKASPNARMANMLWVTSLAGVELGRLMAWGNHPDRVADYQRASPSSMCDLPQHLFEPILMGEALRHGAKIRFDHELIDFTQDDAGVTAQVRDRAVGDMLEVRAKYLVGADGGRSRVAEKLGLPMVGAMGLGTAANVLFSADLSRYVAHRPGSLYMICQPGRPDWSGYGVIRMVRPWTEWVAQFLEIAEGEQEVDIPEDAARELVANMIGDPSIRIEVRGINRWSINRAYASHYSSGRVLCAGDAVHRHPPSNGLGSNTCVQDAYNLGWKLALVLQGNAGVGLLDTYSAERQPIGKRVVERAMKSLEENRVGMLALGIKPGQSASERAQVLERMKAPDAAGAAIRRAWQEAIDLKHYTVNAHGVEMNQHYRSAAVIEDDLPEIEPERDFDLYYHPSATPGSRLPHCWLEENHRRLSTHDVVGKGRFALLTGIGGAAWRDAAEAVRRACGIEIVVREIGIGLPILDPYGDWGRLSGVSESGCVLVRPDMHVAWRAGECAASPAGPANPALALLDVVRSILHLA